MSLVGSIVGRRPSAWIAALILVFAIGPPSFADAVDEDLKINVSSVTGLATFMNRESGAIQLQASGANAAAMRAKFFADYGELFGVADASRQLEAGEALTDRLGFKHTTYRQHHKGVRVFSGVLRVHQDGSGRVTAANGNFYPIPENLSVLPIASGSLAIDLAEEDLGRYDLEVERNELVIVDPGWYGDPPRGPRLAYYVVLHDAPGLVAEAFFVDARTGEILDRWDAVCTAMDRSIHSYDPYAPLPGPLARSEGDPASGLPAVDAAYDYLGDIYDYYNRSFGRDGFDNTGTQLVATVGPPSLWNAYWIPWLDQMRFGDGLVLDDVIGHEFTHGVVQYTADLIYQNEPGQLNESYADIFGELIDLFNGDVAFSGPPGTPAWPTHPTGPGTDTPNNLRSACSTSPTYGDGVRWLMGEDWAAVGAIRDLWDPTCFQCPDKVSSPYQTYDPYDNGGVHTGCGIPCHAFAILTDGKSFNGQTVSGIGPIKAAAVWYRALAVYLTPVSGFAEAYAALNQAAQDLVGANVNDPRPGYPTVAFTAGDAAEVDKALLAVELNTPGGAYALGSCRDPGTGVCVDGATAATCPGGWVFTPGALCADLGGIEPSATAKMIVLIDRTGSMQEVRQSGSTRCDDALEQAKADVKNFMAGYPGRSVAVWTFTVGSPTRLTGGFVGMTEALGALATLDGVPCSGGTALADAICEAVDEFPPEGGVEDKILSLTSDGGENSSAGACYGPNSGTGPPPPGNYDPGSWQKLSWDKLQSAAVFQVRYWGAFGQGGQEERPTIDVETGQPILPGPGDMSLFKDLASSTGGTYTEHSDSQYFVPLPVPIGVKILAVLLALCGIVLLRFRA